ncbi:MAG TPA: DUF3090 family protein [Thermomicrobiaceae bacterium]|nr:DUF3090 family protein [Thermomicrobiaceae bacterium]
MAFEHHEYQLLTVLHAEAIGEPGSRRFRLVMGTPAALLSLWMEKEQLRALGAAIEQLLEQLATAGLAPKSLAAESAALVGMVPVDAPEYVVSRMAIGYDDDRKLVAVFAHDIEQEDEDEPVFSGRASLSAMKALAEQITEVINAGRPRCPRCGAPIGPEGHVCPHNNGHLPWNPA